MSQSIMGSCVCSVMNSGSVRASISRRDHLWPAVAVLMVYIVAQTKESSFLHKKPMENLQLSQVGPETPRGLRGGC